MKRLNELLEGIEYKVLSGDPVNTLINEVTNDSRAITPGALFICIQGEKADGHRFAGDAVQQGAKALIVEKKVDVAENITQILTANTRSILPVIAARFFEEPTKHLKVAGITGTNGKTTTAFALQKILQTSGVRTGLLGTIGYYLPSGCKKPFLTTPDAIELQRYFKIFRDNGYQSVVVEVSSHSLALMRVESVRFDKVVFTNLSRDHLDFHKNMEDYFSAKKRLFDLVKTENRYAGVVNNDDEYGRRLKKDGILSYGLTESSEVKAENIRLGLNKTEFSIIFPDKNSIDISTELLGYPAVYNLLCAASCTYTMGINQEIIRKALLEFETPPGRLQNVTPQKEFSVIIDYAHTPDGLKTVLSSIKAMNPNRIITLFGCGGDRDRGKRPLMAKEVEEYSDIIIVTSDNPRTEDPEKIIEDIFKGFTKPDIVIKITDRREAINKGLQLLKKGDIFLIAGKGHEDYQIIGTERIPFNDREIVMQHFGRT
ncbi:MAG: UDP-N-acetylmuramoyl-L-alanyl-D-glutamate--2,6-diaminopimelate ligase [Candidatus Hydrogenedentota bacterium]